MVQSNLFRDVSVLNILGKNPHGMKATEIAKRLGIPPSTVYNILYRLNSQGLVVKAGELWMITEAGKRALDSLKQELAEVVA